MKYILALVASARKRYSSFLLRFHCLCFGKFMVFRTVSNAPYSSCWDPGDLENKSVLKFIFRDCYILNLDHLLCRLLK